MFRNTTFSLRWLLLVVALATRADSSTFIRISLEDIAAEDWSAQGIDLVLDLRADVQRNASIDVASMEFPAPIGRVGTVQLQCAHLEQLSDGWRCDKGTTQISESEFGAQDLVWSAEYKYDGTGWLELAGFRAASGVAQIRITMTEGRWQAKLNTKRVDIRALARSHQWLGLPRDWKLKGKVSVSSEVFGTGVTVSDLSSVVRVNGLGFSSPDSRYEGAGLNANASLSGEAADGTWRGKAQIAWRAGQLYLDPVFLETDTIPLQATLRGDWNTHSNTLAVRRWSLLRKGSLQATGKARLDTQSWRLKNASFKLVSEQLSRLYSDLLQPFLIGTAGDELTVSGAADLTGTIDGRGLAEIGLNLRDLGLQDGRQRYALSGVNGAAYWSRTPNSKISKIDIRQAGVYRLRTRPFDLTFLAAGDQVRLSRPLSIPVLQGAMNLDSFQLEGLLSDGLSWRASASLRDLSLAELTEAFDWPPFTGTLTARLADMTYRDQVFRAGGGLNLSVFGGNIDITGLQVHDPFGYAPVLEGAARLRALDLDEVTRTFSFGSIQGRLDGDLSDLRLVAWQPNRFALHFYTPDADRSRRRISQRAIENLTELGSGIPAGLSSTLLSIFEEFSYDRIDLNIVLDGNLAELNGIARPDGGYYLVKGAGLPRIDVIGRNRRVAWKDLVERLQQIQVEGAEIK